MLAPQSYPHNPSVSPMPDIDIERRFMQQKQLAAMVLYLQAA